MRSNNIKTDIERKIEKRIKYMDYDFNDYGKVRKEREANKISNGVFFVLFMILAIFLIVFNNPLILISLIPLLKYLFQTLLSSPYKSYNSYKDCHVTLLFLT